MIDEAMNGRQHARARIGRLRMTGLLLGVLVCALGLAAAAPGAGPGDADWAGFGNTPDQNRYSPLTQISNTTIAQLGRVFTVDFLKIDSALRKGEQSYPVEVNGTLYVTTNDDNVFALDATNGKVLWRWQPDNGAVFKNFGIVANRGVAVCDGKVFLLTLDMTIVALNARNGHLIARVPIGRAVPGASSNYGYSETSAPICASHRLIVGAAGSEYGVRGFVMAYRTDLTPAWPNPFWTIPPEGTSWRRFSRLAGGGVVWTPTTVDTTTNTVYFGTGSATPLYYPAVRPGSNPRADSLIAVDLSTGRLKWWQQQMAYNEWSYDTAQPPMVYTAKLGGKKLRVVSVATMEGVWFAYDARTGRPLYQRVRVIDRTEHPRLQPGKPVAVFPSSLGGLNYSPAAFNPQTNYVYNAAAETAAIDIQVRLTPTQKRRKRVLGDVFLGLENGNFGTILPGWKDHGSISAIDISTGRQVWKIRTPEPERGGVTTTAAGIGFAGDGDGVLRAFDLKSGKVLWTFQTGHQIAAGPSVYEVRGKEYVAITSGGTPTSSNGGTATELHVFALGGSPVQSPPPQLSGLGFQGTQQAADLGSPSRAGARSSRARPRLSRRVAALVSRQTSLGLAQVVTQGELVVRPWDPNSSNDEDAVARVRIGGSPVVGARVAVDGYLLPRPTGADGSFHYRVDNTVARRHVAVVVGVRHATVQGRALRQSEQRALRGASTGFSVGYRLDHLRARAQGDGTVLVTGQVHDAQGNPPPRVALFTYQLQGTVIDASGNPVKGAVVVTRTLDRDFWTFSSPSDAQGHYTSFFTAADETSADPVPMSLQVAVGHTTYGFPFGTNVYFKRLGSAQMKIQLPPAGGKMAVPTPESYVGAIYEGLVVGVRGPHGVIKPLAARWPDARGYFSFVLPASARGLELRFWENLRQFFSRFTARPGGKVDLHAWPAALAAHTPRDLATLAVPRG
jgi:alcohol dehydrogenase (cytochrome c)